MFIRDVWNSIHTDNLTCKPISPSISFSSQEHHRLRQMYYYQGTLRGNQIKDDAVAKCKTFHYLGPNAFEKMLN